MRNVTTVDSVPSHLGMKLPMPKRYVDHPEYTEYVYETTPTKTSKWVSGLASAFCPGLGQGINGQWGKGIALFAGSVALAIIQIVPSVMALLKGQPPAKTGGLAIAGAIALPILEIVAIIDAAKHAKSETVQIVPKGNQNLNDINYVA